MTRDFTLAVLLLLAVGIQAQQDICSSGLPVADGVCGGGEIPGVAGVDYPVYAEVPRTNFRCDAIGAPGYYADPASACQAFYICERQGKGTGFLCPNGTLFNQEFLVCDWWTHVDCSKAVSLYSVNLRVLAEMEAANERLGVNQRERERLAAAGVNPNNPLYNSLSPFPQQLNNPNSIYNGNRGPFGNLGQNPFANQGQNLTPFGNRTPFGNGAQAPFGGVTPSPFAYNPFSTTQSPFLANGLTNSPFAANRGPFGNNNNLPFGQTGSPFLGQSQSINSPFGNRSPFGNSPFGTTPSPFFNNGQTNGPFGNNAQNNLGPFSAQGQANTPFGSQGQSLSPIGSTVSPFNNYNRNPFSNQATTKNPAGVNAAAPFRNGVSPFGQNPALFGQTATPFGSTSSPFSQSSGPFAAPSAPFGSTPGPFGSSSPSTYNPFNSPSSTASPLGSQNSQQSGFNNGYNQPSTLGSGYTTPSTPFAGSTSSITGVPQGGQSGSSPFSGVPSTTPSYTQGGQNNDDADQGLLPGNTQFTSPNNNNGVTNIPNRRPSTGTKRPAGSGYNYNNPNGGYQYNKPDREYLPPL